MSIPGVAIGAAALSVIVACVFVLQLFLHEYYNGPFKQILASGWFISSAAIADYTNSFTLALCTNHWLRPAYSNNDQHLQRLDAYSQQLWNAQDWDILGVSLHTKDLCCQLFGCLLVSGKLIHKLMSYTTDKHA